LLWPLVVPEPHERFVVTKESPARLEAPDAPLTFRLRFSPGQRQLGRPHARAASLDCASSNDVVD
jgi:hypothetical protein